MRSLIRQSPILAGVVLAMLVFIGPATESSNAKPPRSPLYFELIYRWGGDGIEDIDPDNSPQAELTLNANGRFDAHDVATGKTVLNVGDWYTRRTRITFELDNGTVYTGLRQSDGSYFGTVTGYLGNTGVWFGRYVPGF